MTRPGRYDGAIQVEYDAANAVLIELLQAEVSNVAIH